MFTMIQLMALSALAGVRSTARKRLDSDAGQTAAEYVGVLVVVGVVLAAIAGSGIGGEISQFISDAISNIFSNSGSGG